MPEKTRPSEERPRPAGQTDWVRLDAMTEDEIEFAAAADPDAPLPKPGRRMRRAALSKRIRFKLTLSQEDFAERYEIPLTVLKTWERHEVEPDAVALTYLNAILADPEGVAAAVAKSRQPVVNAGPKAAE